MPTKKQDTLRRLKEAVADRLEKVKSGELPHVCCGALEAFTSAGFVLPFTRPISISPSMQMQANGWAVTFYATDLSGAPDDKLSSLVYLNYCPFCGKKLREVTS